MHRDRIIAKLNPTRRESRGAPDRADSFAGDHEDLRQHASGKAQRAFGARVDEALRQIREMPIRSRGHH